VDDQIDVEIGRISQRIRQHREAAALTLQELAQRSGVATSTIQKVEKAQMTPSVAVLMKIASGLQLHVAELIADRARAIEVVHQRGADRKRFGRGNSVERLSGDIFDQSLDMWRVTVESGCNSGRDSMRFTGDALIVCEVGRIDLEIAGELYVLESGDSLHFRATLPYRWRNPHPEAATFTLAATLEGRLRAVMHARGANDSVGDERIVERAPTGRV